MVGSLFFFGMGVAAVIFQEGLLPSRTLAGNVNVVILHRLAVMQGVLVTIIVSILGYLAFTSPQGTSRSAFWLGVVGFLCAIYTGLILLPEINGLRLEIGNFDHLLEAKKEAHQRFSSLHSRYSMIVMVQLLAGTGSLILHALWVWKRGGRGDLALEMGQRVEPVQHEVDKERHQKEGKRENLSKKSENVVES